jgi:hypothetical protein
VLPVVPHLTLCPKFSPSHPRLAKGEAQHPPANHPLDANYSSVVDEPQLS